MSDLSQTYNFDIMRLIDRHSNLIKRICLHYSNYLYCCEDLIQECYIALHNSYINFEGRCQESTWVYRVCINTCLRLHRDNTQLIPEPLSDTILSSYHTKPDSEIDEDMVWLKQAISRLHPIDKKIIQLRLCDLSYEEIAANMSLPRNTIASKLRRIRIHLHSLLNR